MAVLSNYRENPPAFIASFIAGILIGMATIFNINAGQGLVGAFCFSFGLIVILELNLRLVTGLFARKASMRELGVALLGNTIGSFLMGLWYFKDVRVYCALDFNILDTFVLAMFCGICIYAAVHVSQIWVPLCIACFVISLAPHCVVVPFYVNNFNLVRWLVVILGNFVGGRGLWFLLNRGGTCGL